MRYFFSNRFNIIDMTALSTASYVGASVGFVEGIIVIIIGALISTIGERKRGA